MAAFTRMGDVPALAQQMRKAAGETGQAIAAHEGLVRMIYAWERGDHQLTERYELLYARALGIAPAELAATPDRQPPGEAGQDTHMAGFTELTRRFMDDCGISVRGLAKLVHYDQGGMSKILRGLQSCPPYLARAIDDALEARGAIIAAAREANSVPRAARKAKDVMAAADDEIAALELARRAEASDIGDGTCERLELAVDDLATAYPRTPPGDLLGRVRAHLGYTSRLLDGRATLTQHRRLLVSGGWLSLLAATCLIDLHQDAPALAYLRTAGQLARETGHAEIAAWCAETRAWQLLTSGGYRQAVELSRAAQEIAPGGGSAHIQATAQEGRAWARLGDSRQTRAALAAVERLVSPLTPPGRPEHHYVYDPPKARVYVATTLAWLGDTAAEPAARDILAMLENPGAGPPRPRRIALARLDLALALTAAGKLDEATASASDAVASGRLVPVDQPRVREIVTAVTGPAAPGAAELAEAYRSEFSDG